MEAAAIVEPPGVAVDVIVPLAVAVDSLDVDAVTVALLLIDVCCWCLSIFQELLVKPPRGTAFIAAHQLEDISDQAASIGWT